MGDFAPLFPRNRKSFTQDVLMNRTQFLLTLGMAVVLVTPSPAREWADATGKFKIDAELADVAGGNVRLKRPTGDVTSIPLARLSAADQEFIKTALARSSAASAVLRKHRLPRLF